MSNEVAASLISAAGGLLVVAAGAALRAMHLDQKNHTQGRENGLKIDALHLKMNGPMGSLIDQQAMIISQQAEIIKLLSEKG